MVPVLITVLAFAVTGIYPFGDEQIAVIDMYHQYVPFLSELQMKLKSVGIHHGGDSVHFAYQDWTCRKFYDNIPEIY